MDWQVALLDIFGATDAQERDADRSVAGREKERFAGALW